MEIRPQVNAAMKSWVRRWVKETMTKLGYPHLGDEIKIVFEPMIRKVGLSEWSVHRKVSSGKKICVSGLTLYFSSSLWPHIGRDERRATVVHECCHLVDAIENDDGGDPHGDTWMELMARLGMSGEATVSIEQLNVSREVIFELSQKCSICQEHGHNARTCAQRPRKLEEKLNNLMGQQ
jgi:predicted SprT family Zn-dependent metalloprotease